jgi:crotonobetainyl-CoA:carnitine CoA-transferase CaiB-like acyl-CoA transferase
LIHRQKTGEGQWVDLATTDGALGLNGPSLLDWTVNGRPSRREGQPDSNRSQSPPMAPHGIYPLAGDDNWVAIACRHEDDWRALAGVVAEAWCSYPAFADLESRLSSQDALDAHLSSWTAQRSKADVPDALREAGVPVAAVLMPEERIDLDPSTADFGLWPTVQHTEIGAVRVDGLPAHFSATQWQIDRGGPCLGEHNEEVLTNLLGLGADEIANLRTEGVI